MGCSRARPREGNLSGKSQRLTDRELGRRDVSDTDARLSHPWLRINRVPRIMLHTRWNAEQWSLVPRRVHAGPRAAGWFNYRHGPLLSP